MTSGTLRFKIGDRVSEIFKPANDPTVGTVIHVYEFDGLDRYVIHFDSGRELVFYEAELRGLEPRDKDGQGPSVNVVNVVNFQVGGRAWRTGLFK